MTDPSSLPPAGWYPDPADPSRTRWWDGQAWHEAAAPAAPAAPNGPVAPNSLAASSESYFASSPSYASDSAYSAAPSYNGLDAPAKVDVSGNTVWIWLIIFVPLLPFLLFLMVDWNGIGAYIVEEAENVAAGGAYSSDIPEVLRGSFAIFGVIQVLLFISAVLVIVFAYLDRRALSRRGVQRPFHWGYAAFVFLVSNTVYVIGRGVVLYRRTGKGLMTVWVWLAVNVVATIAVSIWMASLLAPFYDALYSVG